MNYLYHRTFLCPVPYVHKVGIRVKSEISTIAELIWYNQFNGYKMSLERELRFNERSYYNTGTPKRFTIKQRIKLEELS